jgi:DNA end-binding protein Ku
VISFGLVSVPVRLYTAIGDHTIRFQQYERDTSDRIRNKRVNERTGKEVDYDDIVKGRESNGELVQVETDELDDIAPGRSRAIEIEAFVDLDDIDPIYFQRTYWLAPGKDEQYRPYALLRKALEKTNRAGIARLVMRGKEYLAAVRAQDDLLHLSTLHFAADIRDPDRELPALPDERAPRGKELDMAVTLIESMSEDWDPEAYDDTFNERVKKLLRDKRKGKPTEPAAEAEKATEVSDLYDVLSQSVDERRGGGEGSGGRRGGGKRSGGKRRAGSGRKRGGGKRPDPKQLTKAELDRLARKLDISGRSTMSKAALADAVAAADASSGRQKRAS